MLEVLNGRTREEWRAAQWHDDQQLVDAGHARWVQPLPAPPVQDAPQPLPPPPVSGAATPAQVPTGQPVAVTASLLEKVDGLLST